MKIALFADDRFGSYVFDALHRQVTAIACVVGETHSAQGRLRRKLRALRRRPGKLWKALAGTLSRQDAAPPGPPGQKGAPPTLAARCRERSIPYHEDHRVHTTAFARHLAALAPDLVVVATFGEKIPPAVIGAVDGRIVNLHFSLLPRYRGLRPELCCLLAGERRTGVTVHYLAEDFDTGPIIAQREVEIGDDDTFADLQGKLYPLGRNLLLEVVESFRRGTVQAREQGSLEASSARLPAGFPSIDWRRHRVDQIHNLLRACAGTRWTPYCEFRGRRLYLVSAAARPGSAAGPAAPAGSVIAAAGEQLVVACAGGGVEIREVFFAGRARSAASFVADQRLAVGDQLDRAGNA